MLRCARYVLLTALAVFCAGATADAAPVIRNISLRGLQAGAATTIAIDGVDLLPAPRLVTALPLMNQEVLPNATATRVEIKVTVAADVIPGLYNLRLATGAGISAAVVVAVDKLPQLALNEKEKIPSLPVALHGAIGGPQVLRTSFDGHAGQAITIDAEANRLGSKLRPVVHLYDARGVQLAWAWPLAALAGDARLEFRLPADGVYTVAIHDLQYQAPAPGHFRLKIGEFQYADGVFPPVVQRGKPAVMELVGNVAGQVVLGDPAGESLVAAPWPNLPLATGLRPRITISDSAELVEGDIKDPLQQLPAAPVAVSGRLLATGEEDRYLLTVVPGSKLLFDVHAARLGSPADLSLELTDEKAARLAFADDGPETTDPRLEYVVPAGVERVVVVVRDTLGRGGKSSIYRVAVQVVEQQPWQADFELVLTADGHNVPQAGLEVLQVLAQRNGYDGPIALAFDKLPPGVTLEGNEIPAGASGTLVVLKGVDPAAPPVVATLRGTANIAGATISRTARFEQYALGTLQPWLQSEVALAVAPAVVEPLGVELTSPPADPKFSLGSKLKVPIKLTRSVSEGGPVRITLVTSQNVPRVAGNPDLNQAIRLETNVVEIPIDPASLAAADALVAAAKVLTDTQAAAQKADEAAGKVVAEAAVKVKAAEDKKVAEDTAAKTASAAAVAATEAKAVADKLLVDAQEKAKVAATGADQAAKDAAAQEVQKTTAQVAAATAALAAADGKAKAAAAALAVADKALVDQQAGAKVLADMAAATKADGEAKIKDADAKRAAAATAAQTAAAAAKYASELSIVVPGPLPVGAYLLAIRAEMLSRDRGRVVATTVTAPQRLAAVSPVGIALASSPQLSAKLDAKTGAKLTVAGKLERLPDFKGDATITFAGLPPGIAVPSKVIKPDMADFDLELALPPNLAAGEFKGIKLFATGPPDPAQAGIIVRSVEVPLTLTIVAADPPPK